MTQLQLIPADYADEIDPCDQVSRMPGVDAPCPQDATPCAYPFCGCYAPTDNKGEE